MSRFPIVLLIAAVFLLTVHVSDSAAQSEPGHVFTVRYHKVHPGKTAEYNKFYADIGRPVYQKMKDNGDIVSFLDMLKIFGDRESTHVILVEYASMADLEAAPARMDAASREVLGKSLDEALSGLDMVRDWTKTELYGSTQP